MASFLPPPAPADPAAFAALVVRWWPRCEGWASKMARFHPGVDYESRANLVLWKAAATFVEGRGRTFEKYLAHGLWADRSAAARTEVRRAGILARKPFRDDLPVPGDPILEADAWLDAGLVPDR